MKAACAWKIRLKIVAVAGVGKLLARKKNFHDDDTHCMIWTLSSTKVVLNLSVSQKWRKPKQEAELWFLQLMVRGLSFQPLTLQPLCSSSYVHRLASKVPSSAVVKVVLSLSFSLSQLSMFVLVIQGTFENYQGDMLVFNLEGDMLVFNLGFSFFDV